MHLGELMAQQYCNPGRTRIKSSRSDELPSAGPDFEANVPAPDPPIQTSRRCSTLIAEAWWLRREAERTDTNHRRRQRRCSKIITFYRSVSLSKHFEHAVCLPARPSFVTHGRRHQNMHCSSTKVTLFPFLIPTKNSKELFSFQYLTDVFGTS